VASESAVLASCRRSNYKTGEEILLPYGLSQTGTLIESRSRGFLDTDPSAMVR
jgi:hypothetical protein